MLIKIGTRSSKLAIIQAQLAAEQLCKQSPLITTEIVQIRTTGDMLYPKSLADLGGKGLFLKEIEELLLDGKIDMAVHSMKDVPAELPNNLIIGGVLEREDPRDAFLSIKYKNISDMPAGATIGTCASRRRALLNAQYPDLKIIDLRGNVETRIKKLNQDLVDAIVIAVSGLKRLSLESNINEIFPIRSFIPAVGQGVIALECRQDNQEILSLIKSINHINTSICVDIERAFLKGIGGDCTTPMGAYVEMIDSDNVRIHTFLSSANRIWSKVKECSVLSAVKIASDMAQEALIS